MRLRVGETPPALRVDAVVGLEETYVYGTVGSKPNPVGVVNN